MIDPLAQFCVKPLLPFQLWGFDLSFTNSALFMVVASLLIILFFYGATYRPQLVPGMMQSLAEVTYCYISDMLDEGSGERGRPFFPFIFSLFLFVFMGNVLGMVPLAFTFTSQLIVTTALATLVFFMITFIGLVKHKMRFFKLFLPSGVPLFMAPLLILVELVSYLSRPISLSIRLFANMMAGHTMLKVFAGFSCFLGIWGLVPLMMSVLLTAFEIMVSYLQAYVFTVLTCIYFHDSLYLHDHA